MKRKRWLLLGGILAAVGMLVVAVPSRTNRAIGHARAESVRMLAAAADPAAMEEAVGYLGVIFHIADGSWIAIRYKDCHSLDNFWSSAVALDSLGHWYQSEEHFCGQFRIYRLKWAGMLELLQDAQATREEKTWWVEHCPLEPACFRELEESTDLHIARERLLKLGFTEFDEPTRPRMSGRWPQHIETKAAIVKRLLRSNHPS